MHRKIITTKDGSHSLFLPELNEHYHSSWGAMAESKHVFIEAGFSAIKKQHIRIFEMGFGTGLNALLTLNEILDTSQKVHYTTVEKYPLTLEEVDRLNYPELVKNELQNEFTAMHQAPWDQRVQLTDNFSLYKMKGDVRELQPEQPIDLIYFDAFAPNKQPELWSKEVFQKLVSKLNPEGIMVTYAAKGTVRRCWLELGLNVEKLPGPPGKREFLRGRKH